MGDPHIQSQNKAALSDDPELVESELQELLNRVPSWATGWRRWAPQLDAIAGETPGLPVDLQFVASLVDGAISCEEIALTLSAPLKKIIRLMLALHRAGVVVIPGELLKELPESLTLEYSSGCFPVEEARAGRASELVLAKEENSLGNLSGGSQLGQAELSPAEQANITAMLEQTAQAQPYLVLGLAKNASVDEAGSAYLKLLKAYHPDRFAGKSLGEYKRHLDKIVSRLSAAHLAYQEGSVSGVEQQAAPSSGVSSGPGERLTGASVRGEHSAPGGSPASGSSAPSGQEAAKRALVRKLGGQSFLRGKGRAAEEPGAGQVLSRFYQESRSNRFSQIQKEALTQADRQNWAGAAALYEQAARFSSRPELLLQQAAELYLKDLATASKAVTLARQLLVKAPYSVRLRLILAEAFFLVNLKVSCLAEYERAYELSPDHAEVQALKFRLIERQWL